jgi:hypothetical protein
MSRPKKSSFFALAAGAGAWALTGGLAGGLAFAFTGALALAAALLAGF